GRMPRGPGAGPLVLNGSVTVRTSRASHNDATRIHDATGCARVRARGTTGVSVNSSLTRRRRELSELVRLHFGVTRRRACRSRRAAAAKLLGPRSATYVP